MCSPFPATPKSLSGGDVRSAPSCCAVPLCREYLPDSLTVPFISLMAIHPPARWVYAVGFLLVAVCRFLSSSEMH